VESEWIPFSIESVALSRPIAVEDWVPVVGDVTGDTRYRGKRVAVVVPVCNEELVIGSVVLRHGSTPTKSLSSVMARRTGPLRLPSSLGVDVIRTLAKPNGNSFTKVPLSNRGQTWYRPFKQPVVLG